MNRHFAPVFMILVLVASLMVASRSSAQGGYPAPETATATMPPMTWPACTPNCPTNTPWVDRLPVATAKPDGLAVTPVTSSIFYGPRVWLPFVMR